MYTHFSHKTKLKTSSNEDTGTQFQTHPTLTLNNTQSKQESFSFEVEAEREYVHRLKQQREKIEALYAKYDGLLDQMRKKDEKIKEQQRKISELSGKCQDYTLLLPELDLLRKENGELVSENQSIRYNLFGIEQSYTSALNEYKEKSCLNERQREKLQQLNEQLISKIKQIQLKMEDRYLIHEKIKKELTEKVESAQKQIQQQKSKHINQISILNSELLRREEDIDIISKQNKKLHETIMHYEQALLNQEQKNEEKISGIHLDYKCKIKQIKQEIEEHKYNNDLLVAKIGALNSEIEKLGCENCELRDRVNQQKQKMEQAVYETKLQASQQKSIMRENIMQLESKLIRVEKQLGDVLRREKELMFNIRKMEENEMVKKSIRDVQRRQIEKINRLLLLQK